MPIPIARVQIDDFARVHTGLPRTRSHDGEIDVNTRAAHA